jgi:hypothetical protein
LLNLRKRVFRVRSRRLKAQDFFSFLPPAWPGQIFIDLASKRYSFHLSKELVALFGVPLKIASEGRMNFKSLDTGLV